MTTSLAETPAYPDLEEISAYIRNLKLRSVALGGVDRESVLVSIQELYRMFTQTYNALTDQVNQAQDELDELYATRRPLEKELNALRAEKESMAKTISIQMENSNQAAAAEEKYRKAEVESRQQIDALRKQNQELEHLLEVREEQYKQDLERAKVGAADKSETLEEIYLEARRASAELIEDAQRQADEQLAAAEAEVAAMRAQAEQEIAARWETENAAFAEKQSAAERLTASSKQEASALAAATRKEAAELTAASQKEAEALLSGAQKEAEDVVAKAQAEAARMASESEQAAELSRQNCQATEQSAQDTLQNAKLEAERIIASAKATYTKERERYDSLLVQLGLLRAKTVEDIRGDIAKLNELAFGMTGRGIESELSNAVSLSDIDTASKLAEQVESGDEDSHEYQ